MDSKQKTIAMGKGAGLKAKRRMPPNKEANNSCLEACR